ncbi:TM0106 family RecB-like putative nuclease [Sciscionella sediminilitoris]|uniref:TM0106 family RecB-like putative nuclease n=1 Tax=Sciscionella sediminilitoris TaxID=1445613 RepID=UPI001E578522|nr:TM0106 family RecB-like putative nuclease [Sciscionella sp. SE31]
MSSSPSTPLLDAGVINRCRHRVHLEHDPEAVRPEVPADPAAEQRRADRAAHLATVLGVLSERFGAQLAEGGPDGTLDALREGVALISGAVLPADRDAGRRGSVPLLIRTGEGYLPVLIAHHRITDPGEGARTAPLTSPWYRCAGTDPHRKARAHSGDQLRLAHAWRLLEATGYAAPGRARGGVIGLDADVVLWHDLEAATWPGGHTALAEYDTRFADRLAIANGSRDTAPSRIMACRRCPWWSQCSEQLTEQRDVSLVTSGNDADQLRAAGVRTIDELAATHYTARIEGFTGQLREAIALARAWLADATVIRKVGEVQVPRADVEVDVDMESFGDAGAYLWGCLLTGEPIGIEPGYHPFATWDPLPSGDEGRSFAEFWAWFSEVRRRCAERGFSFRAYCYNERAENRWLLSSPERFPDVAGMPGQAQVRRFIESDQWVDLYACVSEQFLCARGKGLKVVAPVAGFSWRDPEAGGENSMRWYREAVGYGGGETHPDQRDRILRYNEDDVRATQALREWMSKEANGLPHLDEL